MGDNFLSQAEIDALLNQAPSTGGPGEKVAQRVADKIKEVLDQFAGQTVKVFALKAEEKDHTGLVPAISGMVIAPLHFTPSGNCLIAIDEDLAGKVGASVMGQDPEDVVSIDEVGLSVVGEAFSQIAGGISTEAAKGVGSAVTFDPPAPLVYEGDPELIESLFATSEIKAFHGQIEIGSFEPGDIWIVVDEGFSSFWQEGTTQAAASSAAATIPYPTREEPKYETSFTMQPSMPSAPSHDVNIKRAVFSPLEGVGTGQFQNINLLLDVPLEVTVELGRTKMQIKEILELGKGSLIELAKLAGEPVDIVVNGKLLAKGEVVVIDENFGVKIVDIVSPVERVNSLQ